MKSIKLPNLRAPYPKKARALLSRYCQAENLETLPGFSLTPSQVACRYKFDGQNNLLARHVAYCILSGHSKALVTREQTNLDAFDALVCELFALGFTYYDLNRTMPDRTIAALEQESRWSEFDAQLDKRLGFRMAADVQVSLLRERFFDRLEAKEAA